MPRLHDKGPDVKILQEALVRAGMRADVTGTFGLGTQRALKTFQLANHLLPDGIAGPLTMKALGAVPTNEKEAAHLSQPEVVSSPQLLADRIGACLCSPAMVASAAKASPPIWMAHMPSFMTTSEKGKDFISSIEVGDDSSHFHFPGGNSGVTIGAGFDFGHRKHHEIEKAFREVLPPEEYSKIPTIARAAGLRGPKASEWVAKNKDLVDLDEDQIRKLLDREIKEKETMVKRGLHTALYQHEFDALVSVAYNPGGKWHKVLHLINDGRVQEAMSTIGSAVTSKGVMPGLLERRKKEIGLYLYGKYDAE